MWARMLLGDACWRDDYSALLSPARAQAPKWVWEFEERPGKETGGQDEAGSLWGGGCTVYRWRPRGLERAEGPSSRVLGGPAGWMLPASCPHSSRGSFNSPSAPSCPVSDGSLSFPTISLSPLLFSPSFLSFCSCFISFSLCPTVFPLPSSCCSHFQHVGQGQRHFCHAANVA